MECLLPPPLKGWSYLQFRIDDILAAILKAVGIIRQYTQGQQKLVVEPGQSVRDMLLSQGIPPEIIALVLVDEKPVTKEHVISDGETIQVIAVIGGGAS